MHHKVLCLILLLALAYEASAATKPHLVFMLVDDWGWANVGYHCNTTDKEVVTPNMDSLVKEGLELDQHYAYRFCSPSRSCLMSGRLPISMTRMQSLLFTIPMIMYLDMLVFL